MRERAAADWVAWEDAVISQERNGKPGAYSDRPAAARLAFVRICAHYFSHGAWLEEGALLRDAGRWPASPACSIHGRLDLGIATRHGVGACPRLARRRLVVVEDAGHTGGAAMRDEILAALDGFA